MTYDPIRNQLVLFGGVNGSNQFGDTWVWDGTNWTLKSPSNSPLARDRHAMTYSSVDGKVMLFGGENFSNNDTGYETWLWDGTNWSKSPLPNGPFGYRGTSMTSDVVPNRVLLYGATGGQTWVW